MMRSMVWSSNNHSEDLSYNKTAASSSNIYIYRVLKKKQTADQILRGQQGDERQEFAAQLCLFW